MDKFDRKYLLGIQKKNGELLKVQLPFTVEFDIHRNSFSSANVGSIRIYNLNKDNRSQIQKNQYDFDDIRRVVFSAGYGDQLAVAFEGIISQAWSVREGTNFVTQIESFDGGYAYINAVTGAQFPSDTSNKAIIDSLVQSLPGVRKGAIGEYAGQIPRGNSYSGATTEILRELTGGGFFIDNGTANCLGDKECLDGDIPVISPKSGLLGTPTREQQYINFEILFEPNLRIGQLVELNSFSADHFNGRHKVISIKHSGTISSSVSGTAVTRVGLLPGVYTPVPVGQ